MTDQIISLFYVLLPGVALLVGEIEIFESDFLANSIVSRLIDNNPGSLLAVLFIISAILGLLVEGICKILAPQPTEEAKSVYQINRYFNLKGLRTLPEFFSGRAAFFTHMALVFKILAVSLGLKGLYLLNPRSSTILIALACFMYYFASLVNTISSHYSDKEIRILTDYRDSDVVPDFISYKGKDR